MTNLTFLCKWCNTHKIPDEFHSSQTGYMKKKTKCKSCTKIYNKQRYLKHPHYTKKNKNKKITHVR